MKTDDFDYYLPEELIAQYPCKERTGSRLLCVAKRTGTIEHKVFFDIVERFIPGDVLVLNDTKVIPARLFGEKTTTGAAIEVLLLERQFSVPIDEYKKNNDINGLVHSSVKEVERWRVLINPSRRLKAGDCVIFDRECDLCDAFFAIVPEADRHETGMERIVDLCSASVVREDISRYGTVPLPPYIKREADRSDHATYQTVYAREEGAVAAPTAGLHFDARLLDQLRAKNVQICFITLHVSYGTFKPIQSTNVKDHVMHAERVDISEKTAAIINAAKAEGRRVIACGTTTVRALESSVEVANFVTSGAKKTDLFIYPSYQFKVIDGLITNFHLPRSSLFMLVCAWGGTELIKKAYAAAVSQRYRFYSYGDAMLIA
ncbi:MAG: tRNA preQ1(34) S-adenosylmethionine ribosyltransferase-isomerase QueA [Candidatus Omnitrophica bacterium]|nr:tRNA preQ1(34) S-adenosylmethionine ribosyltransferase-isomerase QueA [Candidatus Omnitrophota bacterium]